jgi:hypothetical protein
MLDREDPQIIWVAPTVENGNGTWQSPFNTVEKALERAKPGYTIVLKSGTYSTNVTIQVSGTSLLPIRIIAEPGEQVEIHNSCWFFYDTSDLIVSNLTFRNAPHGAISVIGVCSRNKFDSLRFIDCGKTQKASCTIYFGGAGGECNIVENCHFEHVAANGADDISTTSIGLMVAEGDSDNCKPLRNHLFRKNHLINFGYGILIGSRDSNKNEYGHIVEYNNIDSCLTEGILVKCGDTRIRGNLVKNCKENSITLAAGKGSVVEANRIIDCRNGIHVNGSGHTLVNNCIVRCHANAIRVRGKVNTLAAATSNLFIESNTCIDCGTMADHRDSVAKPIAGIEIEPGTSCVIQRNLIHGKGQPYSFVDTIGFNDGENEKGIATPPEYLIDDNIASGQCDKMTGVTRHEVRFVKNEYDNFENESGYGAQGWMLRPEAYDPEVDEVDEGQHCLDPTMYDFDDEEELGFDEEERRMLFSQFFMEKSFSLDDHSDNEDTID